MAYFWSSRLLGGVLFIALSTHIFSWQTSRLLSSDAVHFDAALLNASDGQFNQYLSEHEAPDTSADPVEGEGFNLSFEALSPAVQNIWDSTWMLLLPVGDNFQVASGFVVKVKKIGEQSYADVLTNSHALVGFCEHDNSCPSIFILNNIGIDSVSGRFFQTTNNPMRIRGAKLVQNLENPDLALLEVRIDQKTYDVLQNKVNVRVLDSFEVGQEVYAIGYPLTKNRRSETQKRIEHQDWIVKRWSFGKVETLETHTEFGNVIFHSADILPGNSGSPLVSKAGELVGLNKKLINPRDDLDYQGGNCSTPETMRMAIAASELTKFLQFIQ